MRDTGECDENGEPILKTDVDFRCLRRTCATLFGSASGGGGDAKSTQSQMRHADPSMTLRLYQKSIPADVKMAADKFERTLGLGLPQPARTLN